MWYGDGIMTKRHRLERKGRIGRPKSTFKKSAERQHYSLGGIPMKVVNGRVGYAQIIPYIWSYFNEEIAVEDTYLPTGDGSFVRRHIYEVRFDIEEEDETKDERRKREYKEWWEKRKV